MIAPSSRGSLHQGLQPSRTRSDRRSAAVRARDARDVRTATMLFTIAVGAVLAIAGLKAVGMIVIALAVPQAVGALYAQLNLWRLRLAPATAG